MKFKAKDTEVLTSSLQFIEVDGVKKIQFQANTEVYVDGNKYAFEDAENPNRQLLITKITLFGLTILPEQVEEINTLAEAQAQAWVDKTYPEY